MLVGLFILRRHDGGTSGLSRVLWKQVWWRFSLAVVLYSLMIFLFCLRKGVIWLALAIATEIPPLVSPATLGPPRFAYLL